MAAFSDMSRSELETAIAAVDSAITRTLNAESYQVGTRQLKRASLKDLRELRAAYAKQLQALTGADISLAHFESGGGSDFNEQ